jgi:hypothetical protein
MKLAQTREQPSDGVIGALARIYADTGRDFTEILLFLRRKAHRHWCPFLAKIDGRPRPLDA